VHWIERQSLALKREKGGRTQGAGGNVGVDTASRSRAMVKYLALHMGDMCAGRMDKGAALATDHLEVEISHLRSVKLILSELAFGDANEQSQRFEEGSLPRSAESVVQRFRRR